MPDRESSAVKLDDTLCYCFHVTRRKVLNFIRVQRPRRASQVSACGGAGTGCGWCVPYIKRCFEQMQSSDPAAADDISPADYARLRAEFIRAGKGIPAPGAIPLPDSPPNETDSSPARDREHG